MCRLTALLTKSNSSICLFSIPKNSSKPFRHADLVESLSCNNFNLLNHENELEKCAENVEQETNGPLPPPTTVKPVKKKSESRKEKCRIAAQCRRSREGQIMDDLQSALPVAIEELPRLEKSTIIRLAAQSLSLFKLLEDNGESEHETESIYLKSNHMFGLIYDLSSGQIVYLPPGFAKMSGFNWTSLLSMSVGDLFEEERLPRANEFLRLKTSILPKTATSSNGNWLVNCWSNQLAFSSVNLCVALFQFHKSPAQHSTFEKMRTKLHKEKLSGVTYSWNDSSLIYEDVERNSFYKLTGHSESDIIGHSLMEYIHLDDLLQLNRLFTDLQSQTCVQSKYLRLLTHSGSYKWTKIILLKSPDEHISCKYIVCQECVSNLTELEVTCDQSKSIELRPTNSFEDLLCSIDLDALENGTNISPHSSVPIKLDNPVNNSTILRAPRIDMTEFSSLGLDDLLKNDEAVQIHADDVTKTDSLESDDDGSSLLRLMDDFNESSHSSSNDQILSPNSVLPSAKKSPKKRDYVCVEQNYENVEEDHVVCKKKGKTEKSDVRKSFTTEKSSRKVAIPSSIMNLCDELSREFVEKIIATENQSEFQEILNRALLLDSSPPDSC